MLSNTNILSFVLWMMKFGGGATQIVVGSGNYGVAGKFLQRNINIFDPGTYYYKNLYRKHVFYYALLLNLELIHQILMDFRRNVTTAKQLKTIRHIYTHNFITNWAIYISLRLYQLNSRLVFMEVNISN